MQITNAAASRLPCQPANTKLVSYEHVWAKQVHMTGTIVRQQAEGSGPCYLGAPTGLYLKLDKDVPFDKQKGFVLMKGSHVLLDRGFKNARDGQTFSGLITISNIARAFAPENQKADLELVDVYIVDKFGATDGGPNTWAPLRDRK